MTGLDLRPLSLGEVLDRTFTLYRRHFLLFVGISAIPSLLMLALRLVNLFVLQTPLSINANGSAIPAGLSSFMTPGFLWMSLLSIVVGLLVYIFTQGGTIFAVSELYLGRTTSIGAALSRVSGELGGLFGVIVLNALAVLGASLLLVIPGIYVLCRLLVCVPAALIEGKGPSESLSRSWHLTKGFAGRAFVLYLLYIVISFAMGVVLGLPLVVVMLAAKGNPDVIRMWQAITQVLTTLINMVIVPFLLIGTSVYYYDLRVRKEAFDLQFMMDPTSEHVTRASEGLNSITP